MEPRKCLYCKEPIPPGRRSDSKFCNNSCKAWYWEEKKKPAGAENQKQQEKKPDPGFSEGLRGVVDTSIKTDDSDVRNASPLPALKSLANPVSDWIYEKQETPEYKEAVARKAKIENYGNQVLEVLKKCDMGIQLEEETLSKLSGKAPGYVFGKRRDWNVDMEALAETYETQRQWDIAKQQEESRMRFTKLNKHKENLLKELDKANREMNVIMNRIKTIPQFKTIIKKKPVKLTLNLLDGIKPLTDEPKEQNEMKIKDDKCLDRDRSISTKQPETTANSSRIISSKELSKREYKGLNFQSKWLDFFGRPSTDFHCSVHGKPGEGKSTFCIQFAHYLAKNHGKTIYISGEEGFQKTLKDKLTQNNAITEGLDISDVKNYEEMIKEIQPETFYFIFIDSLNNMGIDAAKMKEIRKRYRKSALITISQSTKAGKMRGSQEIEHDADITVSVADGIATTTKNRFKQKYMELQVFENPKPKPPAPFMPRNTI